MTQFSESVFEQAALGWFAALGYDVCHGADIAPKTPGVALDGWSVSAVLHRATGEMRRTPESGRLVACQS